MVFLDWQLPFKKLDELLLGALTSVWLTALIFVLSFILGTCLALMRIKKNRSLMYRSATVYTEIFRNTPALVQIYLIYYGLPQFGIILHSMAAGILALSLNNAAYVGEILRSGIQSIDKGQWEAADSLALSPVTRFIRVVFPQALRNIFPSLINQYIMLFFGTTLLSTIDVTELMQTVSLYSARTFRTIEFFTFAAVIYFVLSIVTSYILRKVNRRFFPSLEVKK